MSEFSKSIYELRHAKKLSQRKVSQELGISQALLSHYENGVRQPKLVFVRKIASYYGVSSDDLLGCAAVETRPQLQCETELIAQLAELFDFINETSGTDAASAAAQYLRTGIENVRAIVRNPADYNPQHQIVIKTAEAALYAAANARENA